MYELSYADNFEDMDFVLKDINRRKHSYII